MDNSQMVAVERSAGRGYLFLVRSSVWRLDALALTASLLVVQLLLVTLSGVWTVSRAVLDRGSIHVDIRSGVSDQRIQELYAAFRELPAVSTVSYVTREQVFAEEQQRDASLQDFLERTGIDNPFSDAFRITLRDRAGYSALRTFVQDDQWKNVIDASSLSDISMQDDATGQLLEALGAAHTGLAILTGLAAFVALFLACSLVARIARERQENVRAERLAGATAGIAAAPTITAAAILLLGVLVLSLLLTGAFIAVLTAIPASAVVSDFLLQTVLGAFLSRLPVIVGIEVAVLALVAWVSGRIGSMSRV